MNRIARGPSMVSWAAVLSGAVIGVGLLLLFSALWMALAQESDAVADNIEWYSAGTAIGSLLVAGLFAGYLSGIRGTGPGVMHGLTVWGLAVTVTLILSPQALETFNASTTIDEFTTDTSVWATFVGLAASLVTGAIGGAIGGAMTRPVGFFETMGDDDEPSRRREMVDLRDDRTPTAHSVEGGAATTVGQRPRVTPGA